MLIRLALVFSLLVACAPSDRLQRSYNHDTLIWHTVSRDAEVYRDGVDHVLARTIILEGGGNTRYYLSLSFLRGGPNGPKILTIQHDGQPLPYVRYDRLNAFCIDHCHKAEIGQIQLTKDAFRRAANDGMSLQADGLRRNYPLHIPARLFYRALQAANLLDPTRAAAPK